MAKKKIAEYCEIQNKWTRTIVYNKRRKGIIKKAMELSVLCGQKVMLAIHNQENNKLVIYQSEPDFTPTQVNNLLSSEKTLNNLYEEHTNLDMRKSGTQKP